MHFRNLSLLFRTWKLCQNIWSIFSYFFLFLFFYLLGHLSIFLILYFCIATYLSLALRIWREDNYKELRAFIPNNFFCVFSQCRSKTFLSGWTSMFFVYSQCRSSRYMWSVRDLNLESMINFLTRVNKVWPNST
jgi:hypothetical protein